MNVLKAFVLCVVLLGVSACGQAKQGLEDGYGAGAGATISACAQASWSRMQACTSWDCMTYEVGFARGCARDAQKDAAYCAQVPSDILAASAWIKAQCATSTFTPKACYKVMQQYVAKCLR